MAGEQQHGRSSAGHHSVPCRAASGIKKITSALIEQMDDEGLDDFTRVRELLGLATGKDNGWYTLRVGELKAMLASRPAAIWNRR